MDGFRKLLTEKRDAIIKTMSGQMPEQSEGFAPDEIDQATTEHATTMRNRFRQRNAGMLKKLETALRRIAEGEYDECIDCGDIISRKRLKARPETTMCIICKEEQERKESAYVKPRSGDDAIFSF